MSLKKIITFSILAICFSSFTVFAIYVNKWAFNAVEIVINDHSKYLLGIKINIICTIIWTIYMLFNRYIKINTFNIINQIEIYVKQQLFNFIQSIPYEDFVKITSEKAYNNLDTIANNIKEIYQFILEKILLKLLIFIGYMGMLFYTIPSIGFLLIIWGVLYILIIKLCYKKLIFYTNNNLKNKNKFNQSILESISNILMIKTNNTLEYEENNLNNISINLKKSNNIYITYSESLNNYLLIFSNIVVWLGVIIIIFNKIVSGNSMITMSTSTFILMITWDTKHLITEYSESFSKLFEHLGEYETIYKFFSEYKITVGETCNLIEIKETQNPKKVPIIEFENINMSYGNTQVLKNINFKIYKGEKVCFIGSSGSGKSTIVNLLCGIYKNYTGNIYINGHNINKVRREDIINIVSIVNQNYILFTRSVKENLIQDKDIEEEKIVHYSKIAAIDEFINDKSEGYNTLINSKTMSGGQAQRICLARMLIREKPIKIFDEATNGLDAKNKKLFLDNILDNKYAYDYDPSNDTLLFVDHSLEFLNKMSKVVLLNEGEILLNDSYDNIKNHEGFLQFEKFIVNS
jgi:ABC-type multidrug transport system fused ATPase/permease subunit